MTAVAEPFDSHVGASADANVIPLSPAGLAGLPSVVPLTPDEDAPAADAPADPLRGIALASARLERLQWERDAVEEDLCAALRQASGHSVSAAALARAAGISMLELEAYLQRPALGAAPSPFPVMGL